MARPAAMRGHTTGGTRVWAAVTWRGARLARCCAAQRCIYGWRSVCLWRCVRRCQLLAPAAVALVKSSRREERATADHGHTATTGPLTGHWSLDTARTRWTRQRSSQQQHAQCTSSEHRPPSRTPQEAGPEDPPRGECSARAPRPYFERTRAQWRRTIIGCCFLEQRVRTYRQTRVLSPAVF